MLAEPRVEPSLLAPCSKAERGDLVSSCHGSIEELIQVSNVPSDLYHGRAHMPLTGRAWDDTSLRRARCWGWALGGPTPLPQAVNPQ
jgi:hypothetical protein